MIKNLSKVFWIFTSVGLSTVVLMSSVFASLPFTDSKSLTFNSGTLTLNMGQSGSSFYLDSVNISGKPLSCEVKAWTTLIQRNNCDDASFSYNGYSDIKIYVQLDNDQGTWTYNPSSQLFTDARRWVQDVTDNNNTPVYNNGYIELSTNGSSFNLDEYLDLSIRMYNSAGNTDTSNRDQVRFTILKKSGSAYYNASSSDYYLRNSSYTFTSSDRGYVTLEDYVRFYTSGTYKIRVENTSTGRISETVVYIGNNGSSNNEVSSFSLQVSPTNPSLNQYIDTTVTARDRNGNRVNNYIGTVRYVVEKRDTNSSFWYSASASDYTLSTASRYISANQQGTLTVSDHLRFHNNGNYRLRVYDSVNSSVNGYQEFTIWSSSNITNRFDLSTNRSNLSTDEYANLTIKALHSNGYTNTSYNNTVRFEVYRRSSSSSSWTNITNSSTNNSNYRIYDTSYRFTTSQNGVATLNNFIKFYSNSYDYMVKVIDQSNSSLYGEIIFYVKNTGTSTNTNVHRFIWSTSPRVPELYDNIAINIQSKDGNNNNTNTTDRVTFSLERKLLPTSNTWTKTGVNTACKLNTTSYTFNSSDYGQVNLSNVVRCTKKWFYRLKITNSSNNNVVGYVYFTIVDTNDFVRSLPWFTNSQRQEVQEEYRVFMAQVNEWEAQYPRLSYNTKWNTLWKNYYNILNKLAYGKSGKVTSYAAYERARDNFYNAFYSMR